MKVIKFPALSGHGMKTRGKNHEWFLPSIQDFICTHAYRLDRRLKTLGSLYAFDHAEPVRNAN